MPDLARSSDETPSAARPTDTPIISANIWGLGPKMPTRRSPMKAAMTSHPTKTSTKDRTAILQAKLDRFAFIFVVLLATFVLGSSAVHAASRIAASERSNIRIAVSDAVNHRTSQLVFPASSFLAWQQFNGEQYLTINGKNFEWAQRSATIKSILRNGNIVRQIPSRVFRAGTDFECYNCHGGGDPPPDYGDGDLNDGQCQAYDNCGVTTSGVGRGLGVFYLSQLTGLTCQYNFINSTFVCNNISFLAGSDPVDLYVQGTFLHDTIQVREICDWSRITGVKQGYFVGYYQDPNGFGVTFKLWPFGTGPDLISFPSDWPISPTAGGITGPPAPPPASALISAQYYQWGLPLYRYHAGYCKHSG